MKLIFRIALRLSAALLPLLALWAGLFYYALMGQIRDETDDALWDYSELVILRMLGGERLPQLNEGSNNSYSITPVDSLYAATHPWLEYYDAEVYIPEKEETEPARVMTTLFQDEDGLYYELKVATPTFEKDDLLATIFGWVVFLYLVLLVTVIGITILVFHRSMRPLYDLLKWLDEYLPGGKNRPVPNRTRIEEFRRLNLAAQQAVDRSEALYQQQKQFIGNASHELQTPLAVLSGRLEWLLDHTELTEEQMGEVLQMQRTLKRLSRLNKTLLLLTKIDNHQFPESTTVDIASLVREQQELYCEIFSARDIHWSLSLPETFPVQMNESLASVLVTNLMKNACLHSEPGAEVQVRLENRTLTVSNPGTAPLDQRQVFKRFYQGAKKEGSNGLGLALVKAVADYYGLPIAYRFLEGRHCFSVSWP